MKAMLNDEDEFMYSQLQSDRDSQDDSFLRITKLTSPDVLITEVE